jgi:hypothetical protein
VVTSEESRRREAWDLHSKYQAGNRWGCRNAKSKVHTLKIRRYADKPQRGDLIDPLSCALTLDQLPSTATQPEIVSEPGAVHRKQMFT